MPTLDLRREVSTFRSRFMCSVLFIGQKRVLSGAREAARRLLVLLWAAYAVSLHQISIDSFSTLFFTRVVFVFDLMN